MGSVLRFFSFFQSVLPPTLVGMCFGFFLFFLSCKISYQKETSLLRSGPPQKSNHNPQFKSNPTSKPRKVQPTNHNPQPQTQSNLIKSIKKTTKNRLRRCHLHQKYKKQSTNEKMSTTYQRSKQKQHTSQTKTRARYNMQK